MVFHVLNRGAGRRVLFTKDEDFLAFERRFGGCPLFPRVKWQSQAVKLLPAGDKKLLTLYLARQAMYEFRHPYRD